MSTFSFTGEVRAAKGKGAARKYRAQGKIPAILYGANTEPIRLSVEERLMNKALSDPRAMRTVCNITISRDEGTITKSVIVKEIQRDAVSRKLLHLDFYEVDMEKPVTVNVPVRLEGHPIGVDKGGMLEQLRHELTISCLPAKMLESIVVDVSNMDIGEPLHVSDLKLGEGIEVQADTDLTIATVVAPHAEKAPAEEEIESAETGKGEEGGES